MNSLSGRGESKFSLAAKRTLGLVIYIAVFYVLSFGPAVSVFRTTQNETLGIWIEAVYRPLESVRWRLHLNGPLEWYVGLWD